MGKTLFWTRPLEDWQGDLQKFPALKEFFHLPLTSQMKLPIQVIPPKGAVIIVTSPKAATMMLDDSKLSQALRSVDFLSFSKKVSEYLPSDRLELIRAANAEGMIEELIRRPDLRNRKFYFLGAKEPAFPIAETMQDKGYSCVHVPIYETLARDTLTEREVKRLEGGGIVCLASPSAARSFLKLIESYGFDPFSFELIVIGSTTADACGDRKKQMSVLSLSSLENLISGAFNRR